MVRSAHETQRPSFILKFLAAALFLSALDPARAQGQFRSSSSSSGPPTISSFTVSPSVISQGQSVTLRWATDSEFVCLKGQNASQPSGGPCSPWGSNYQTTSTGTLLDRPDTTTTYTLIAVRSGQSVSATSTVTVQPMPNPCSVGLMSSIPPSITLGESLNLPVRGANCSATASTDGAINVSFPSLNMSGDESRIVINSHSMPGNPLIIVPKTTTLHTRPGSSFAPTIVASYAGVEEDTTNWAGNTSHTINVTVTPKVAGNFLIQCRESMGVPPTNATYLGYPTSGPTDQQDWWVQTYTVTVQPPVVSTFVFSPISAATAGAPFQVTLTAREASGNVVPFSGRVYLSAPGNSLSRCYADLTNGQATVNVSVLNPSCSLYLVASSGVASGQSNTFAVASSGSATGAVGGFVRNSGSSNQVVPGATVTITAKCAPSTSRQTVSASNGNYLFNNLPPGPYDILAEKSGLKSATLAVTAQAGITVARDLAVAGSACNAGIRRPILLVPGILGSSTGATLIPELPAPSDPPSPDDVRWGLGWVEPNRTYGLVDPFDISVGHRAVGWQNLIYALTAAGYEIDCTLFPVPYDWRMTPDVVAQRYLHDRIGRAKGRSGVAMVDVIAHSMGGLVARAYNQSYPGDIDHLALVGTPNHGSAKAYFLWEGGDPKLADDGDLLHFYQAAIEKHYLLLSNGAPLPPLEQYASKMLAFVHQIIPSAQSLLPTSDVNVLSPGRGLGCNTNGWLDALNASPSSGLSGVKTYLFGGTNQSTFSLLNVTTGSCGRPSYPDGIPFLRSDGLADATRSNIGDGTVLASSLTLPSVLGSTFYTATHQELVLAAEADIMSFLGVSLAASSRAPVVKSASGRSLSVSTSGGASFILHDPAGAGSGVDPVIGAIVTGNADVVVTSDGVRESVAIPNALGGEYRVTLRSPLTGDVETAIEYGDASAVDRASVTRFIGAAAVELSFTLRDSGTSVQILGDWPAPRNLRAVPTVVPGGVTKLSWLAPIGLTTVGYNVYSKTDGETRLTAAGSSWETSFVTADPWVFETKTPTRVYAVSAVVADGSETFLSQTTKNDDRDGDGLTDVEEAAIGTNPDLADTDGDGLTDLQEVLLGTSPFVADTDGDGASDYVEYRLGTDPLDPNSVPIFGPSQGSLFVPIVLDVTTATTRFTTELTLSNRGATNVVVRMGYTQSIGGDSGSGTVVDVIPAGSQVVIPDAVAYLRGRGLPVLDDGTSKGGTLVVGFEGAETDGTVAVVARTTAATAAPQPVGSAGLAYGALNLALTSSQPVTIFGLRSNDQDRSNVAVYNTGSTPVVLKVTVTSGSGDGKQVVVQGSETLAPWGWFQHSGILAAAGITNGYVTVERVSAEGSFDAYGVINDNATNDGSFVPSVSGGDTGSTLILPVLVETSAFRSELVLANKSTSSVTFNLNYLESLTPSLGPGGVVSLTLAAGEQRIIPEAIDYFRRNGATVGSAGAASYAGAVRVSVQGAPVGSVFVGARTASPSPAGGQYGLFTPSISSSQAASSEAWLLGLRADDTTRSNVAVANAGVDSSGPITLSLQVFDGESGGAAKGDPQQVVLLPGQWSQLSGFLASRGIRNGFVRVSRTSGVAAWIAYGVLNDGGVPGSRTGDGAYVRMVITTNGTALRIQPDRATQTSPSSGSDARSRSLRHR